MLWADFVRMRWVVGPMSHQAARAFGVMLMVCVSAPLDLLSLAVMSQLAMSASHLP